MPITRWKLVIILLAFLTLPTGYSATKNVTIPVLVPMFGNENDRFGYRTGMKYAFELINNRSDILQEYRLVPQFLDTVGSAPVAIHNLMLIMDPNRCMERQAPPVILGPSYSQATIPVARLLSWLHVVQLSYGATSPVLDDVGQFQYTVKTLPGSATFNRGNVALLKKFGWKRVGIVYDHQAHDGIFSSNSEDLIKQVKSNNLSVVGVESMHPGSSPLSTTNSEIRARLEKLKAYKLGMYGKNYVWIVHPRAGSVTKWLTAPSHYKIERDCTNEEYEKFGDRMLLLDTQTLRGDSKRTISGLTAAEYNQYVLNHRIRDEKDADFHHSLVHAYGFDAVWIMALMLNKSITGLKKINSSLDKQLWRSTKQAEIMKASVLGVNFEGVTGPINFDPKYNNRFGTFTLHQIRDGELISVGTFEASTGELELDPKRSKDMWIDGKVPLDVSLRRTILLNIPLVLYGVFCTVAGLGIVLAIGILAFNIYHRNDRYIRKSAPLFNNIIVCGIMLCLSTVAYFGLPVKLGDTDRFLTSCKLRSWILCLGFSLAFGSMFVKTWRVYKIFTNRKLKYSIDRLGNMSLFLMIISIVAVDFFILLLWEVIDPMEVKLNTFPSQVDPDDSNVVRIPMTYSCHSSHQNKWVTAIYSIKGILLLYGLFLAYETRNVQFEHLNDSRMIGVSVYNVAVMSILGGLLRVILSETYYRESFGITSVCIIFPSLGTLFLIFLPKVVRFVKNGRDAVEAETSEGVVIEGPGTTNSNVYELRKDSVCSEGITSVSSSSLPYSNSRIMPIYEEANSPATARHPLRNSPVQNSRTSTA